MLVKTKKLGFVLLTVLSVYGFIIPPARAGLIIKAPGYLGLNARLVGYWTFDGKDMAGFPSTAAIPGTAYDISGQGNNGKYYNATGTAPVIGKLGQALSFDGVDDYVSVGDIDFASGPITLAAWINQLSFDAVNNKEIISKDLTEPQNDTNYSLRVVGGTSGKIKFTYRNSADTAWHEWQSDNIVVGNLGQWYHVAITYTFGTAASMQMYVNGASVPGSWVLGTGSDLPITINNPTLIGSSNQYPENTFSGSIDDVRIYNRALTRDEIKRLYNMGR